MDAGRLKTIGILILLCVNLAFGGILLMERLDSAEGAAHTRTELVEVMAGLGIRVPADLIPADLDLPICTVSRDRELEDRLVRSMLGETEGRDQGGNIRYYENKNGWAWCRGGGNFEIMVLSGGGSLEAQLAEGGIRAQREGDSYVCLVRDVEIFNCRFSLSQRSGGIYISGRCILGEPVPGETPDCTDPATLLLRFYDLIRDSGGVFSSIEELRTGYVLSISTSGMVLDPVWRMQTDGGVWYLDLREERLISMGL